MEVTQTRFRGSVCVPVSLGTGCTPPQSGSSEELYDAHGSGRNCYFPLAEEGTEVQKGRIMDPRGDDNSIMLYMSGAQHNLGHTGSDQ